MSKNRIFFLYWLAVFFSVMGDSIIGYALGIWIYEATRSVTFYTLFPILTIIPIFLVSPFIGVIMDRYQIKSVIAFSFIASSFFTILTYYFILQGFSALWWLAIMICLSAVFSCALYPALSLLIANLVDEDYISRASALFGLTFSAPSLLAPIISGILLAGLPISKVVFLSMLIEALGAVIVVIMLFLPIVIDKSKLREGGLSFIEDLKAVINYIRNRQGLIQFMVILNIIAFCLEMLEASAVPFFIEITSKAGMSLILTMVGIGSVSGGLLMTIIPGPKRRIISILLLYILVGAQICLAGIYRIPLIIGALCVSGYFILDVILSLTQAVYQTKVDKKFLGRFISIDNTLSVGIILLSYLFVGPIIDRIITPLSRLFFGVSGTVPGTRLLWLMIGGTIIVCAIIGYNLRDLRKMDDPSTDPR